ncbi:MAG: hypothetical protein KatS3mg039_0049 [Candidatus Kapaibacterium sp.]|nr:MAG: hypothetical protein KatS3mg039_0049 [Candidatus Kapabacteria bacterium]
MCAKCRVVAAAALLMLAACVELDWSLLEGRWILDQITLIDSSPGAGLASTVISGVVRGHGIEFRQGRMFIPANDTLRFDYQLRRDSLHIRSGPAVIVQFRIRTLTQEHLELETVGVRLLFRRND